MLELMGLLPLISALRTGLNIRFRVTEKTSMSQHVADMLVKPEWKIESSMWAERKDEDESNDVYTSSKVGFLHMC